MAGRSFAETYADGDWPMLRDARQMVRAGASGEIRVVQAGYPQDLLTEAPEKTGRRQAEWRSDSARSGAGGAVGDIGTHARHLAGCATGLEPDAVGADPGRFAKDRSLDDSARAMLRCAGGAGDLPRASRVAPGSEDNLRIRVFGTRGGINRRHGQPNRLHWSPFGQPTRAISRSTGAARAAAARVSRIRSDHPDGRRDR